jgi:dipeptide/tripeptide permease
MQQSSAKPMPSLTLPWLAAVDFMERLSFFGMNAILVLYLTAQRWRWVCQGLAWAMARQRQRQRSAPMAPWCF